LDRPDGINAICNDLITNYEMNANFNMAKIIQPAGLYLRNLHLRNVFWQWLKDDK